MDWAHRKPKKFSQRFHGCSRLCGTGADAGQGGQDGPHAILEAKRGWDVPSVDQLKRYMRRRGAEQQRLISVSAAGARRAVTKAGSGESKGPASSSE